ncbi:MAG: NADH-quinone oxidoreductase subunit N [Anaerolineae bacterium]
MFELTLSQTLTLLSPQLLLVLGALVVFGLDLVWRDDAKKGWLPYVALLGLAVALVATLYLFFAVDLPSEPILGGMLAVDPFALFFQIVAALVGGLVILSALDYMRDRTPYRVEFYVLFLIACLAVTLVAAGADLIMIYISIELLSITAYILTGYLREDRKSSEAAIKYFLYGAMASAVMLYGMSLLYGVTGATGLSAIAASLGAADASLRWLVFPALIFMLAGFGFKIAAVPFHQWSPDAYEGAPTPVTAFLSVGPKAAGFAVLVRVLLIALPDFRVDWVAVLTGISMVTMTLGNLVAIWQKNIKRMLAYSSIAHAGYILIGLVCWDLWQSAGRFTGINGVLIYLLAYLFTNLGAFVVVIAFEEASGSNQIEDYAGLARSSPALAAAMLIFLFSLTGIPGTGGFIGKLFVFGAAIQVQFYVLAIVAIVNSVIAAFYYLNVVRYMFFEPATEEARVVNTSLSIKVTLAVTTAMTLIIGLYAQPFIELVQGAARMLIG